MRNALATTLAAGLLAVSSFAYAADNNGGNNNGGNNNNSTMDNTTTGDIQTRDGTGDLEDQQKCREGTGGGAPCQEMGTGAQQ